MDRKELNDIVVSWLALSVAFMFLFEDVTFSNLFEFLGGVSPGHLGIYLFIVAVSFLSHEFGHRQVARKYGFKANYEMWPQGLVLALVTSLIGFLFAAPGAVVIRQRGIVNGSRETLKKIGLRISIAGIAMNLLLGLLFLFLLALNLNGNYLFVEVLERAARINILLALFNLLPIPPLDGSKVLYYSKKVWVAAFLVSLLLLFLL
ncbi:MAG: M50 family metallopeptidase [Candidatus Aenigmatarchaeota archaeon]